MMTGVWMLVAAPGRAAAAMRVSMEHLLEKMQQVLLVKQDEWHQELLEALMGLSQLVTTTVKKKNPAAAGQLQNTAFLSHFKHNTSKDSMFIERPTGLPEDPSFLLLKNVTFGLFPVSMVSSLEIQRNDNVP
ncbi:UNVERIFIED_CONTAM: hypothetical protein K2H54_048126 [Gekko kuhli]